MWALNKPEAGYLVLGFLGALVSVTSNRLPLSFCLVLPRNRQVDVEEMADKPARTRCAENTKAMRVCVCASANADTPRVGFVRVLFLRLTRQATNASHKHHPLASDLNNNMLHVLCLCSWPDSSSRVWCVVLFTRCRFFFCDLTHTVLCWWSPSYYLLL